MAVQYSFNITQGATTDFRIEYLDSELQPIDLTGYSAAMQIKSAQSQTAPAFVNLSTNRSPDGTGLTTPESSSILLPASSGSIGIYTTERKTHRSLACGM